MLNATRSIHAGSLQPIPSAFSFASLKGARTTSPQPATSRQSLTNTHHANPTVSSTTSQHSNRRLDHESKCHWCFRPNVYQSYKKSLSSVPFSCLSESHRFKTVKKSVAFPIFSLCKFGSSTNLSCYLSFSQGYC